jgi:hypothetical protein
MNFRRKIMLVGILLAFALSFQPALGYMAQGSVGVKGVSVKAINNTAHVNVGFEGSVVGLDEKGKLTETAIRDYRNDLNLSEDMQIRENVAIKAVVRKATNSHNYNKISYMVRNVPAQKRETLMGELVDMDEGFTERFADRYGEDSGAQEQVNNYIGLVEGNVKVRATVSKPTIKDFLTGRVDKKTFIVSILSLI